jgi:hypothetical protein
VSLNAELVGKTYPPVVFPLVAERVSAFANVIGHPGNDDVPPTLVTAPEIAAGLQAVLDDPDLGLDLSRVLHAAQEYEWGRPLTIGETLTAEATIADIRSKGDTSFVTLRTELRDEGRRVVVVATSTLVVRGDA